MTLSEERHLIESHHPGWHVFVSDAGKPWAVYVHHPDNTGCGTTLTAPGMARMDQVIAEFEHAQHFGPRPAS
jgi:hypothetical protein